MSTPSDPPPPPRRREVDLGPTPAPLPLALELPKATKGVAPTVDMPAREMPPARRKASLARWLVRVGVVLVVLGAAAAAVLVWVLPWYVRRECIEAAAAHGIALTIDDVSLEPGGFQLVGVHATATAIPGARAEAPEIDVQTTGLQPDRMTVRRATLTLAGSWSTVEAAFTAWRASPKGGQGGSWSPTTLVVDESRVVWQGPFAENARVEAANTHLDVTWGAPTATVHARSDNVVVVVPAGKLGPWRVDLDRTPDASRVRLALDPAVPDACTVLVVGNDAGPTSVDVKIPRSPLARLGVGPELVGLRGKALQVEATAHYGASGNDRGDVTAKGGLFGIEAGLPAPIDVNWDGTASGDRRTGLDVKKAHLAVGPMAGAMTGTVKTFDDGFRVDLAWSATAVPCAAFEAPAAAGSPLDVAFQLRKLAEGVGLAKVAGEVSARGTLSFDSRDLGAAHVEFAPQVKCQVSLFGQ
ncbi:MAG: hypothetical protein ABSE49_15390 [Polyangiaceae bacterium]